MRTCEIAWARAVKPVEWYRCVSCHKCFQSVESTKLHNCDRVDTNENETSTDSEVGRTDEDLGGSQAVGLPIKQEPIDLDSNDNDQTFTANNDEETNSQPTTPASDSSSPQIDRSQDRESKSSCYFCLKHFRSSNISSHYRTHTKELPFNCDKCEKAFNRSDHLTEHVRKTHYLKFAWPSRTRRADKVQKKSDKPNSCYFCGKSFYSSSTLRRHISLHNREIV